MEIVSENQYYNRVFAKTPYFDYFFQGYFFNGVKDTEIKGELEGYEPKGNPITYSITAPPVNGRAQITLDGKVSYMPNKGYIGIDKFEVLVSNDNGASDRADVRIYVEPTTDELVKTIKDKFPNNEHPRLVLSEDDFSRIKSQIETNEFIKKTFENIIKISDEALELEPFTIRNRSAIEIRVINLALAYRLSKKQEYFDRLWLELKNLCDETNFPNWDINLDVAVIGNAVSLAFDWLYYDFTPQQRRFVANATIKNTILLTKEIYDKQGYRNWSVAFNNYNGICSSSSGLIAMTFLDEEFTDSTYNDICTSVLQGSIGALPRNLISFQPDGAFYEGLGYMTWMMRIESYFLSCMEKSLGLTYGDELLDNYYKGADFINYVQGGKGEFNFCDTQEQNDYKGLSMVLYCAEKANNPEYAWLYYKINDENGGDFTALLYYNEDIHKKTSKPKKNDVYYKNTEVAFFHTDFGDKNENYVGFISGSNVEWHTGLEIGNFVIDSMGVRWISCIGGDRYDVTGYGDKSGKTPVYRRRAEGRNTLVINPRAGADQMLAHAKIESFKSSENGAFAIGDLSPAYRKSAVSVKRGIKMFANRTQFLLQDEIHCKAESEIWSFMHTTQKIEMGADNKSSTLVDDTGKSFIVKVLTPANAILKDMEAKPLPTSPNVPDQTPNTAYRKLGVHITDTKDTTIVVWMVPVEAGESFKSEVPLIIPLANWEFDDIV